MKRLLLTISTLALTGCATLAQYKAGYVEEFAGYDCNSLSAGRALAEVELKRIRNVGYSAPNGCKVIARYSVFCEKQFSSLAPARETIRSFVNENSLN